MPGIPAVPSTGAGFAAVADIARRRAQGWSTFGQVFVAPDPAWVEDMRSGAVRERLAAAISWRTGEAADFGPALLTLGAFDRGARRRSAADDLQALRTAYAEVADAVALEPAHGACALLQQLTVDESAAWSSGDLRAARELRVHEDGELRGEAGDVLQQACAAMLGKPPRPPYLALVQLCQLWLGKERAGSSIADAS